MSEQQRVVIVGAGHAGGRAALSLRERGFEGEIMLIGQESETPYERPPLSKEMLQADEPDPHCGQLHPSGRFAELGIDLLTGTKVTAVDPAARVVELGGHERLGYDRLLLATGSKVRRIDVPGADLEGVHYLRTKADVWALRSELASGCRVAVIGGGFVGLEVAASAISRGCQVTVLEAAPSVLGRVLPPDVAAFVTEVHRRNGVEVKTGCQVERLQGASRVESILMKDGTVVEADVVVVGIGIEPDVELAEKAGLACNNGISVDEYGRTSADDVFAAGDVTNHVNRRYARSMRLESWDNAEQQARIAASNMLGEDQPYAAVPWFWTDQYALNLQILGLVRATATPVMRSSPVEGQFSILYLEQGRVEGAVMVNKGGERRPIKKLIESGVQVDPAELQDDRLPLKKLLKAYAL